MSLITVPIPFQTLPSPSQSRVPELFTKIEQRRQQKHKSGQPCTPKHQCLRKPTSVLRVGRWGIFTFCIMYFQEQFLNSEGRKSVSIKLENNKEGVAVK
jgi:hypothetical protein